MTRIAKLYEQLLRNKRGKFADLQKLLLAHGFRLVRVRGSHEVYVRDDVPELIVIQPNGKEAMDYQIREFLHIVEEYQISMDD
jgi:predicted RNA binding protein YcfA (HicA-like mRNA interferase family)